MRVQRRQRRRSAGLSSSKGAHMWLGRGITAADMPLLMPKRGIVCVSEPLKRGQPLNRWQQRAHGHGGPASQHKCGEHVSSTC